MAERRPPSRSIIHSVTRCSHYISVAARPGLATTTMTLSNNETIAFLDDVSGPLWLVGYRSVRHWLALSDGLTPKNVIVKSDLLTDAFTAGPMVAAALAATRLGSIKFAQRAFSTPAANDFLYMHGIHDDAEMSASVPLDSRKHYQSSSTIAAVSIGSGIHMKRRARGGDSNTHWGYFFIPKNYTSVPYKGT